VISVPSVAKFFLIYTTLQSSRKEASIEFDACWNASLRARFGEKAAFLRYPSVAIEV